MSRDSFAILYKSQDHHFVILYSDGWFDFQTPSVMPFLLSQGDVNIVASFDRRGEYIYTGNSRGKLLILSCPELEVKTSFRIGQGTTSAAAIKSIEFARRTEWVFFFSLLLFLLSFLFILFSYLIFFSFCLFLFSFLLYSFCCSFFSFPAACDILSDKNFKSRVAYWYFFYSKEKIVCHFFTYICFRITAYKYSFLFFKTVSLLLCPANTPKYLAEMQA